MLTRVSLSEFSGNASGGEGSQDLRDRSCEALPSQEDRALSSRGDNLSACGGFTLKAGQDRDSLSCPAFRETQSEKPLAVDDKSKNFVGLGLESEICGAYVAYFECEDNPENHSFGKRIFCGRQWCPRCGQDNSEAHRRRYMRIMDKIFSLDRLGVFVFTIPQTVVDAFLDPVVLSMASNFVAGLLKKKGFDKRLLVWHFFGDGKIREGRLRFDKYHPHLNVAVEGGWLSEEFLDEVKKAWAEFLEKITGKKMLTIKNKPVKKVDVHYCFLEYSNESAGKFYNRACYITRPTFKQLEGWEHLARALFRFRNIRICGKWDEEKGARRYQEWIQELREYLKSRPEKSKKQPVSKEVRQLSRGICFICGGKLRFVNVYLFSETTFRRALEAGYYAGVNLTTKPKSNNAMLCKMEKSKKLKYCHKCWALHREGEPCVRDVVKSEV